MPNEEKAFHARDHLANERTFLAWIRTSIAIMAFGFVVVKFSLFLKQLGLLVGKEVSYRGISPIIGVFLVGIGAIVLVFAYVRYRTIHKKLRSDSFQPDSAFIPVLAISILVVALVLIFYLTENILTT